MIYKILINIALFLGSVSMKANSQSFDSLHVYALPLNSLYTIRIDQDLIKNETDPIVITNESQIASVFLILNDTVKGKLVKKLDNKQPEIRAYFEFFTGNKVRKKIGITPYRTIYFDNKLYSCEEKDFKFLDRYIQGFSESLGVP
jgi:hypothetical protein